MVQAQYEHRTAADTHLFKIPLGIRTRVMLPLIWLMFVTEVKDTNMSQGRVRSFWCQVYVQTEVLLGNHQTKSAALFRHKL